MNANSLKDLFIGVCFIFLEVILFKHLSFFGATPDPLLVYLLWLSLRYDRFKIVVFAGLLGFIQDALFDYWGLYMFAKTLLIFFSYGFINRRSENRLLVWQITVVVFFAALIHNIIFFGLAGFIDAYSGGVLPIFLLTGKSLYTAVLGAMLFIFKGN